jgi:hypothetical protein
MRLNIPATSVRNIDGVIHATISEGGKCKVSKLKNGKLENVITVQGSSCVLLWGRNGKFLVSVASTLHLVSSNGTKPVLRARHGSWFWHTVEACGKVFVQEYGESPTGIHVSEDLENFRLLETNKDVDPLSKHFHYIAFDEERNTLIATLSNGNIVWGLILTECEYSWKPLYKGLWRFVSVLVEEDKVPNFNSDACKRQYNYIYILVRLMVVGRLNLQPLVMMNNLFNLAT